MRTVMPDKLLNDEIIEQIKYLFEAQLVRPVELIYFEDKECSMCEEMKQLLSELELLSDKLSLTENNLNQNMKVAHKYGISLAPSLVVVGSEQDEALDFGIRFIGIPSGYEFSALIQTIIMTSKCNSGLKPETRHELAGITVPVNFKVFVTPT
jgi:alkyl hydroperoxide reductase subunit AhpF